MSENFSQLYCPHCNASIDRSVVKKPKRCSICNGIIWYSKNGTGKGYFEYPDLPIAFSDILVISLLIAVLIYAYFYMF